MIGTKTGRARERCVLIAMAVACGNPGASQTTERPEAPEPEARITTGDEVVAPPPVADLAGAAEAPPEPEVPEDTVGLTTRMTPRRLHVPEVSRGQAKPFTFDGQRRGWFARVSGQRLLTPIYGDGKVYVGGGFGSHQVYALDSQSGEREWVAAASDGGPSAAIYEDDKILFNTESCTIFTVDARTGRRLWSRWLGDPLMSQPTAANGRVFSAHLVDSRSPGGITPGTTGWGVGNGRKYAFTAMDLRTGQPRWTRQISGDVMNAAVIDEDSVYFTTMDGVVYKLDQRRGRVRWRRRLHASSAPWLDGEQVHVTVRVRDGGETFEKAMVLSAATGETLATRDEVEAGYLRGRPDPGVHQGWAYEGSRPTVVDGRMYQTIGNEVQSRDASTGELLWRRQYTEEANARPASPPAIAGSQLVFGTKDGVLFGLDIDTGMTTWAYEVGEPISAQPTAAHGWVYASTTRGGVVALEVSDRHFDGWHMWGGDAAHNGPVLGTTPPSEEERPSEGTLRLSGEPAEGEAAAFLLQGTEVEAKVSGFVARVSVEQTFANPFDHPVEAVYLFPLPDDAAVDAMELRAGSRVVRAEIMRREQARESYEDARDRGVLASLLEQERPNLFRQSVANIAPGDEIRVTLHYTQALPYEEGSYRFVYPMVAGPRYEPGEDGVRQVVLAPGDERPDRVAVRIEADLGTPVRGVRSPTHRIETERDGPLVSVALQEAARPDRDLDVRFEVAGEAPTVSTVASPPADGQAGHVSFALHPRMEVPDEEVMPRELVFLVDTSSSMLGRPMELAKAAMRRALGGLRATDTFRVLSFSDMASSLSEEALPATEANVTRGLRFVNEMRALGATEMKRGIRAALEPEAEDGRMRVVLLMTDGYIGNETEIFREVEERLGQSRVFAFGVGSAVNRYLLTRLAEVGRGDVQVVTLEESPEEAADRFHERIARPFVTDLRIDWGELRVSDAYPRRLPDLFADRPLMVHARYPEAARGEITIHGRVAGRPFAQRVNVVLPGGGEERPELESVWARTRIRDLMLAMALRPSEALREEVTQLGLRHHLLTEWTAFLAIDEGYRADGDERDADAPVRLHQPAARPAGVHRRPRRRMRRTVSRSPLAGLNGVGGYGSAAAPAAAAAEPMPAAEAPTARREVERGSSAAERSCYEQARRADGTIDQAALQDCLRRVRGASRKGGEAVEPGAPERRVRDVSLRQGQASSASSMTTSSARSSTRPMASTTPTKRRSRPPPGSVGTSRIWATIPSPR